MFKWFLKNEKLNLKMKLSNNSSFVILIFAILKFRNIGRFTFRPSKFWPKYFILFFFITWTLKVFDNFVKFHKFSKLLNFGKFINRITHLSLFNIRNFDIPKPRSFYIWSFDNLYPTQRFQFQKLQKFQKLLFGKLANSPNE